MTHAEHSGKAHGLNKEGFGCCDPGHVNGGQVSGHQILGQELCIQVANIVLRINMSVVGLLPHDLQTARKMIWLPGLFLHW